MRAGATLLLLLLTLAGAVAATNMDAVGDAPGMSALDVRLKYLESELRCLVCQNQTLADSNADLAADLRREVRSLALAGKSDDEIKAYLVARYGDFVLYRPPVKPVSWILWFGPFALLVGGGLVWWVVLRRRLTNAGTALTDGNAEQDENARRLLDDDDSETR